MDSPAIRVSGCDFYLCGPWRVWFTPMAIALLWKKEKRERGVRGVGGAVDGGSFILPDTPASDISVSMWQWQGMVLRVSRSDIIIPPLPRVCPSTRPFNHGVIRAVSGGRVCV